MNEVEILTSKTDKLTVGLIGKTLKRIVREILMNRCPFVKFVRFFNHQSSVYTSGASLKIITSCKVVQHQLSLAKTGLGAQAGL